MTRRQSVLSVGFFLWMPLVQALEINRCQPAEGPPQFTNQPCPEGVMAEPLTLIESTPLDSRAVRASMARTRKGAGPARTEGPQVILIADTYTAERNARISGKLAKKKKKKRKKRTAKSGKKGPLA